MTDTPKKKLVMPPGCVDVTAQHLGKAFALVGAKGLRKTNRPRPPARFKDVKSRGFGHSFVGAEAFRRNATIGKKEPDK